jgi:hypothetical protein
MAVARRPRSSRTAFRFVFTLQRRELWLANLWLKDAR